MSKTTKILIIIGVVLAFILLLYFFGGSEPDNTYVTDDWTETYDPDDKGPYGTYMLKELLDTAGLFGNFLELNKDLPEILEDDPDVNDIYFFVGSINYLDNSSADFLHEFLQGGNTVFMSCEAFPLDFLDDFAYSDSVVSDESIYDSVQHFKFTNPDLASKRYDNKYIYNNKTEMRHWYQIDTTAFTLYSPDTSYVLGGNTKNNPNFVKLKFGEGLIYLHSTPYLFTNISLMKRDGFEYAEKILRHIPPGRIQWDRYNLNYQYYSEDGGDGTGGDEKRQSILQFILSHPPLFWSLMILIIGGLLYALFKGKRMQKIIPAAELKENTSLGYITTLSSLYMQENKHHKLVKLKERTFLNFIAEHYYITCKTPDDKFFEKVAVKSQIDKEKIAEIFKTFSALERVQNVTDEQLILLHKKIEYFYKKCR